MISKESRFKSSAFNIGFALLFQLVTAISGLILPKLLIEHYGSDANGLVSSISQFLSYITLLEAGAGGVICASLYRPLSENKTEEISGIVVAARNFYQRIGFIFLFYVAGLCLIYPFFVKTIFSIGYIVSMILILSIGTIFQYFIGLSYVNLITADQKARIISIVNIMATLLNLAVTQILIIQEASLHVIKLISSLIFAFKPLVLWLYVRKKYQLNRRIKPDNKSISQRWNGLVHHIAYFIHTNTDIAIITVVLGTSYVSIYAVYYAIVVGIEKIVTSISNGIAASFGNLLINGNKKSINDVFDKFEFLQSAVATILFSITGILIIPFMGIYTSDIVDMDYIRPAFAFFLVLSEAVYCFRCIYSTVSLAKGMYKQTQAFAVFESLVNLIISIILIYHLGLVGVAIGTLCGMGIRMILDMVYAYKKVIDRSLIKAMKLVLVNIVISLTTVFVFKELIDIYVVDWKGWILYALLVGCVTLLTATIFYLIFYRNTLIGIYKSFVNNLKGKRE